MSKKTGQSKHRPEQVAAYIEAKGWAFDWDDKKENYKIKECCFCGNSKGNFEIQKDRGFYKTWCCGEQGSFYELRKAQGDLKIDIGQAGGTSEPKPEKKEKVKQADFDHLAEAAEMYHQKIFVRAEAMQYIKSRGFNEESLAKFKIGCTKQNGKMWLTIPHIKGGKVVNIKYRLILNEKKMWRQEEGSVKILFNSDCLSRFEEIIFVEGELKAVALVQMGFENVVSLTGGVQTIKPEWIDELDGLKKIYMCLDSDEPGQKAAEELSMRFGPERCFNIKLEDAKDPDEWFFDRKHTADEFRLLMRKAKQFGVKNVVSVNDALGELYTDLVTGDDESATGLTTPWEAVNKLTRGFRPGELIILSAPPKIGKTTWALDVALHQARRRTPVGFFCLEMSAKRLARKMIQNLNNKRDEDIDEDIVAESRYRLSKLPIYMVSRVQRGVTAEDIFEAMKLAYRRYGIKLMVFDNLHFLVRGTDKLREQIGEVSQQFKLMAEELRIPIILIVHPRKLNRARAMTADDFKESSSIHADADQIIMLHRKRKQSDEQRNFDEDPNADEDMESQKENAILSPETEVLIDASRFTEGGKVLLWYEGEYSKFITMDERRNEF